MKGRVLVDAGPLIAILNEDDQDHDQCVKTLKRLRGPLVTTWMPITEAMHLLAFSKAGQEALLEMIERGALQIVPITKDDLHGIRSLMRKYADLAMDFADATLVHVAARERMRTIFTLDRRDFGVYRVGSRGARFTIIPD